MCVCACPYIPLVHQIWHSSGLFPSSLSLLWLPVPFHFSALWVALSDRRNCYSQTVIMWCELWLPPDSPVTIQWHQANVSRAVRKPHDGDDCWEREREREKEGREKEKREGGRSLGAVFRDVVPPIVLSVWLSLMVRLFASPMPFMSLHQSASQTFDLQFKKAPVKIFYVNVLFAQMMCLNHK